ncbi:MAG: ATP-binding protein [Ilumatobacteraceae bacterium]
MTLSARAGLVDGAVIMVVDHHDSDGGFIHSMLVDVFGDDVAVMRAHTRAEALELLALEPDACVVLDLGPAGRGDGMLALLVATAPKAAIVVLTGEEHASAGLAAVAAGAQDYLVKGRTSSESVGRAVRYALVRKRTELRAAGARAQLAAIVDSSADAIFSKTLDGLVTSWSAGAARMFGYSSDDMVGQSVARLIPADLADTLGPLLETIRRGDRIEGLETQRVRSDGVTLEVWSSISPIRELGGAIVGASTVCRDMSEHNRVATERRRADDRQHHSERLEGLGNLAGSIAHDFGNLLGIVLNYAEFVVAATADQPQVLADAEQIQRAALSAVQLTKQLLSFVNSETIVPVALDLSAIVRQIEGLLRRTIGDHIDVIVNTVTTDRTILADRSQIEQVIMNLVVNARDAMSGGGTLTIGTRPVDHVARPASASPELPTGPFVELVVRDTGTGMSADTIEEIFEPFFTTKPPGGGTGLGLATVDRIVAEVGGRIECASREGLGTTFRLLLPASQLPGV